MAGIGLFPINTFEPIHTGLVRLLALILAILLLGVPLWLPGFPAAFHLLSLIAVASLVGAALLWQPFRYYNLTALELGAAGIIFGWLVVFIRNTAAVVDAAGLAHALPGEPAENGEA
jgi:hypothetical protein